MSDIGQVFPPRDEWDVAAYSRDDIVDGYREYRHDDVEPGENRSPSYRWGWANAKKDSTNEPDGYEKIRYAYIRLSRHRN